MKKKPILIVWGAAFMVALIVVGLIWWNHRDLYFASKKGLQTEREAMELEDMCRTSG